MFSLRRSYWRRKNSTLEMALKSCSGLEFYETRIKSIKFYSHGMNFCWNVVLTQNDQKWSKMVKIQIFLFGWNRLELSYLGCLGGPWKWKNANFWNKKPMTKITFLLGVNFPTFTFWPPERPQMIFYRHQRNQAPCWSWLSGWTT